MKLMRIYTRLEFMEQMDSGEISPDPPLKNEFFDYIKYIKCMRKAMADYIKHFRS